MMRRDKMGIVCAVLQIVHIRFSLDSSSFGPRGPLTLYIPERANFGPTGFQQGGALKRKVGLKFDRLGIYKGEDAIRLR